MIQIKLNSRQLDYFYIIGSELDICFETSRAELFKCFRHALNKLDLCLISKVKR